LAWQGKDDLHGIIADIAEGQLRSIQVSESWTMGRSGKIWKGMGRLWHPHPRRLQEAHLSSDWFNATDASFTLNVDILRPSHPWAPYRRPRLWRQTSSLEMLGNGAWRSVPKKP
jgi:hypothetical protein